MATRKAKKKTSSNIGKGILAVSAAAALGGYLLYGSENAKKNRKIAKGWMLKVQGEVLEKVEMAKSMDANDFDKAVDVIEKKYKKIKSVKNDELSVLVSELKKQWKSIEKRASTIQKKKVSKKSPKKKTNSRKKPSTKGSKKKA